jgi:hypothetical protein
MPKKKLTDKEYEALLEKLKNAEHSTEDNSSSSASTWGGIGTLLLILWIIFKVIARANN